MASWSSHGIPPWTRWCWLSSGVLWELEWALKPFQVTAPRLPYSVKTGWLRFFSQANALLKFAQEHPRSTPLREKQECMYIWGVMWRGWISRPFSFKLNHFPAWRTSNPLLCNLDLSFTSPPKYSAKSSCFSWLKFICPFKHQASSVFVFFPPACHEYSPLSIQVVVVQNLNHVQLVTTPWTTAPQASLSWMFYRSP